MLERKIKLYSIDELSDEAQNRVIEREKENIFSWYNETESYDRKKTLELFEKATETEAINWHVDAYDNYVNFEFNNNRAFTADYWDENLQPEDVHGKLLWRWVNVFVDENISRKDYYKNGKNRTSRIAIETIFGGWCPFTGVYTDADILDPIVDAYIHPEKIFGKENYTLVDLISECYNAFFEAWKESLHFAYTDRDFLLESLHFNEYEDAKYLADGTRCEYAENLLEQVA